MESLQNSDDEHDAALNTNKAGHLYAVAAGGNYAATKLGRSQVKDPDVGLKNRYQTSLCPLNIISVVPVVDHVVAGIRRQSPRATPRP